MFGTLTTELVIPFVLRGGNEAAYHARDPEILDEGPTGTGKTLMWLNLENNLAWKFPGFHGAIIRKHQVTMTSTCLKTFNEEVLRDGDGVAFFGGNKDEPAGYRYPNGSFIFVLGLDDPRKLLSLQLHFAYVNEAVELSLEDWETLKTRVRPHGEPLVAASGDVFEAYRIGADANPSIDRHWLLQRCNQGVTRHIKSRLQDNPLYFTDDGTATAAGEKYLANLATLTGTRYQRLVLGEWVGMENAVYPQLDPSVQLQLIPEQTRWEQGAIGVDFGRVHLSAVVAIQRDSTGIVWVRDCWAENGGNLQAIEDATRGMKVRYGIRRGVCDPIQEVLAQRLGFTAAKSGAGSRKQRISYVTRLLDAGALRFDAGNEQVKALFDEALGYRYETRETDTSIEDVVVRKDDDRVAALEYAIEAYETIANPAPALTPIALRYQKPQRTRAGIL